VGSTQFLGDFRLHSVNHATDASRPDIPKRSNLL